MPTMVELETLATHWPTLREKVVVFSLHDKLADR